MTNVTTNPALKRDSAKVRHPFEVASLCICIYGEGVGVKVPEDVANKLLSEKHVVPFQPFGKPKMREWIQINRAKSADYRKDINIFRDASPIREEERKDSEKRDEDRAKSNDGNLRMTSPFKQFKARALARPERMLAVRFTAANARLMSTVFRVLLSLLVGVALGWLLLAGFCSIPGVAFSVACGHNAYIWLPVFVPAGVVLCWFLLRALSSRVRPQRQDP